jgi:carbonic anhydrase/acetyltransferase-like protein (isoleucine patch superfamily)
MLIEHQSKRPNVDPTAYVASTAVICGDVTIGPRTHVSFGTVIEAHGAPVRIGAQCVVRENLSRRSFTLVSAAPAAIALLARDQTKGSPICAR